MNLLPRVLIGTASFGSRYGLANSEVMDSAEVSRVIRTVEDCQLSGFDTAQDYTGSELMLREVKTGSIFTKITKDLIRASTEEVLSTARTSLVNLNRDFVEGISFHSSEQLLANPMVAVRAMNELRTHNFTRSWGVSVYDVEEMHRILDVCRPDFIQAPVSVADQSFLAPEVTERLQSMEVDLHARSIFLQGALLMKPYLLPKHLSVLRGTIDKIEASASELSLGIREFLIGFVGGQKIVSRIVVGVNSHNQLEEFLDSCLRLGEIEAEDLEFPDVKLAPELRDPRLWSLS
jgi:aryl-alcohol dehydrogenase-like predicted oxidoreductase